MTSKEWAFLKFVVEEASKHAYERGRADGIAGTPSRAADFRLTNGQLLVLNAELSKFVAHKSR